MQRLALFFLLLFSTSFAWAQNPRLEVKTSVGSFQIELYPDKAPKTVANFLQYIKDGSYDGTVFHRVIDGFMIQGGGFDQNMRQKPTRAPIENEAGVALAAGLRNTVGTIAMARTSNPNSATAQFFINVKNNDFLDYREPTLQGYGYTPFGRVVEGMETVLRISKVPTKTAGVYENVPQRPVVIESIKMKSAK